MKQPSRKHIPAIVRNPHYPFYPHTNYYAISAAGIILTIEHKNANAQNPSFPISIKPAYPSSSFNSKYANRVFGKIIHTYILSFCNALKIDFRAE
jgi:hypothetical protein